MSSDVFISYSSQDQIIAEKVCSILEKQGIKCWIASREILPGHPDWAAAINQAIQTSPVFVLIYSERSNQSDQILNEIHNADACKRIIITFKIDHTPYSQGLEYFLQRRQWLDAVNSSIDTAAEKLAKTIPILLAGDVNLANRILRTTPITTEPPAPGECPYKGLNYFDESDAHIFFGREKLIAKLVGHLREHHFLAVVVGSSGSGKSSVIRAGMIPALRSGSPLADNTKPPQGSSNWPIFIITPGIHPLDSLALALSNPEDPISFTERMVQDLSSTSRALHLQIAKKLKGTDKEALLIVDQFEELFTLCRDQAERKAFVDNLISASSIENGGLLRVVITLRADFYAQCAEFENLRQAVSQHQEFIGPMSQEELRKAIEEPARQEKWLLESGLVDLLLREVGDEPGALPLLSHALLETWKRREGRWLTVRGYVESGGVRGAIAHTAEEVYNTLSENEQKLTRRVFLSLTELGEGKQDTRRRALLTDILSLNSNKQIVQNLLKKLTDSRLITTTSDSVELAHEALIREWPRLKEWINEDRQQLRVHRKLNASAQEWIQANKEESLLYRGIRLAEAIEFDQANPDELNETERHFLAASQTLALQEEQNRLEQQRKELETAQKITEMEKKNSTRLRKRNRVITIVGIVAVFAAVIAALVGGFAVKQTFEAAKQTTLAQENFEKAQIQSNIALSRQLAAQTDDLPLDLSLLLNLEALKISDTVEARGSLLTLLNENPYILEYMRGHNDSVGHVAFNPTNHVFASSSVHESKEILIWDADTQQQIGEPLLGQPGWINALEFSPDGSTLASGSTDGSIFLWDVENQTLLGDPLFIDSYLWDIDYSPDGKELAAGYESCQVNIWDVEAHQISNSFSALPEGSSMTNDALLKYSPDGKILAVGCFDKLTLWDTSTHTTLENTLTQESSISSISFSPDGQKITLGLYDGEIAILNTETLQPIGNKLAGHTDNISNLLFNHDGSILYSSSFDNSIILWDVETQKQIGSSLKGHTDWVNDIALSSDGKYLVSAGNDQVVILWNVSNPGIISTQMTAHSEAVSDVAMNPNGQEFASGSWDGSFITWNLPTFEMKTRSQLVSPIRKIGYSPDGTILVTVTDNFQVFFWNPVTGSLIGDPTQIEKNKDYDFIFDLAFSPDNKTLAVVAGETIVLIDTSTQKIVKTFLEEGTSECIAFTPDGQTIISGNLNDTITFWDISSGNTVGKPIETDYIGVSEIAISSDGKILASSGDSDGTIDLWDVESRIKLGKELDGHKDAVSALAFSPDDKLLVSGGSDNSIVLWDFQTRQQLGSPLNVHQDFIQSLSFSPDGKYLVSGSNDHSIVLWNLNIEYWKEKACAIANRNLTQTEWNQYFPYRGYELSCPNAPDASNYIDDLIDTVIVEGIQGDDEKVKNTIQTIEKVISFSNDPWTYNRVCWYGSLYGAENEVKAICDQAVNMAEDQNHEYTYAIHDSRGVNRALTGNFAGAIEDFKIYIDFEKNSDSSLNFWQKREQWIVELEKSKNPIDKDAISELRSE